MLRVPWPLVLLVACDGGGVDVPTIEILSPEDGATVCGDPFEVEVAVAGFELVPIEAGEDQPDGSGHVDLTVNGQNAAMGGETSFSFVVPPGEYQLKVELVNANHSSLDPYAGDLVYVTVTEGACP